MEDMQNLNTEKCAQGESAQNCQEQGVQPTEIDNNSLNRQITANNMPDEGAVSAQTGDTADGGLCAEQADCLENSVYTEQVDDIANADLYTVADGDTADSAASQIYETDGGSEPEAETETAANRAASGQEESSRNVQTANNGTNPLNPQTHNGQPQNINAYSQPQNGQIPYVNPYSPPQGGQPYPQYGQNGQPIYMYNNQFYRQNPPKKPLNTSVKVLITLGICLTVIFGAAFIGYGIAGGGMFDSLFDNNFSDYTTYPTVSEESGGDYTSEILKENEYISEDFTLTLKPNDTEKNETSSVRKAYDKISVSTVAVSYCKEESDNYDDYALSGSGIILSRDGYILTNSHVINDSRSGSYVAVLSDATYCRADIVGFDTRTDLAVLKIRDAEKYDLVPAEFADSDQIKIGEQVIVVGNPGGYGFRNSLADGVVSAIDRKVSDRRIVKYIQTNAAINPGNSGGPLANLSGEVIGINTIKISQTSYEGMGFAIPSRTAQKIVQDIVRFGFVQGRVRIGMMGSVFFDDDGTAAGIEVDSIDSTGPLAESGIKRGDVITALDDSEIRTFSDLYNALELYESGDEAQITYKRFDRGTSGEWNEHTVLITLAEDKGNY